MSKRSKGRAYEIKAKEEMEASGWVCWIPPQASFNTSSPDIFELFDLVCKKGNQITFIQVKSGNASGGMKKVREKITAFLPSKRMQVISELWEWKNLKSLKGWRKTRL